MGGYHPRIAMSLRVACQRDIDEGRMTTRQMADKYDLNIQTVKAWVDKPAPAAVREAMRVRECIRPHALPWVTKDMLTGRRAPVARMREVVGDTVPA